MYIDEPRWGLSSDQVHVPMASNPKLSTHKMVWAEFEETADLINSKIEHFSYSKSFGL